MLPASALSLGIRMEGKAQRVYGLLQLCAAVPVSAILCLWQYSAALLGSGTTTDGQPLVLSADSGLGHLCCLGFPEVAFPAPDMGHHPVDLGAIYPVDHGVYVFPPLSSVLHEAHRGGSDLAIYRAAHIGYLPHPLSVPTQPADHRVFL